MVNSSRHNSGGYSSGHDSNQEMDLSKYDMNIQNTSQHSGTFNNTGSSSILPSNSILTSRQSGPRLEPVYDENGYQVLDAITIKKHSKSECFSDNIRTSIGSVFGTNMTQDELCLDQFENNSNNEKS